MGLRHIVLLATEGMPVDSREVALQIVETTWPGATDFSAGHACFLRSELRKHYPRRQKIA